MSDEMDYVEDFVEAVEQQARWDESVALARVMREHPESAGWKSWAIERDGVAAVHSVHEARQWAAGEELGRVGRQFSSERDFVYPDRTDG
jgi:hypothetical protein